MKKKFAKIHLWISLPFGLIIAIVCLTGAILVFEDEILELRYPSRYFVEEVKEKPLSIADLMVAGREQLPDSVKINGIRVTSDSKRTYQLVLPGKKSAAFINPYTGEVTGVDDGLGFFMQMMRLHRWLMDTYKRGGEATLGKDIVGYSSLALAIILISGIVIWLPRNKRMLKNRLRIRIKSGWRRFFYDLHVSGGFYATLLLLVLTLTGLTWSFDWYRDAFYWTFGVSTEQAQTPPSSERKRGEKGHGKKDEQTSKATNNQHKDNIKTTNYIHWDKALANVQNHYTDFNSITVQDGSATVSTAKYGNTRGSDRYSFDSETGDIIEVQLYKDLPKSAKIRGWIYSVHVGSWGGIITRILSCLVSLLGAVFVITGYYFWIKKKVKTTKK